MAPDTDVTRRSSAGRGRGLTPRERRRRIALLIVLLILLALLSYATYYFVQNRRLPSLQVEQPKAAVQPPEYLFSFSGRGANQLQRPVGIGIGPDRRVYVVDFGRRRVSIFTANGRYLASFNKVGGDVLRNPVHLWVTDSEVWVTDRRHRAVFVFDLDGKFKRRFTPKNEKLEWTPLAIALTSNGEPRITDVGATMKHRVHYFTSEGSRTVTFGKTVQANALDDSPGGFYFPNGIAISKDGRVFVSDGDNRRIQVFDDQGEFKGFVDTSGVPRGIAIDAKQRLYAVDALAHAVDIYSLKGERITQFGSQGFGPGQFNYPNDIALDDSRGRIYITDRDNNQVQVWGWPVAAAPAVPVPSSPLGWLACLSPLFLLPFLLLLRKTRFVVTPDFVDALVEAGAVRAVHERRRLRLVAPLEDRPLYEGRIAEEIALVDLIDFEEHSESDARAIGAKLEVDERESILLAMASREKGLATESRELRRHAVLAELRALDFEEFREDYLNRG